MMSPLEPAVYSGVVARALDEDLGSGDITTEATVPAGRPARGMLLAKSRLILAGFEVAVEAFRQRDPAVRCDARHRDGDECAAGEAIATIYGTARALLEGERTALNFLQRLSGIATITRAFVDAAAGRITILDTRKTTPTLRALEKYAVAVGGGKKYRMGLFDAVLIKDNHIQIAGGVAAAVHAVRERCRGVPIEVETQSLGDVDEALASGADIILLDNMAIAGIREAVKRIAGRAKIEISGGVTIDRIPELASTGADFVSAGALTHSAPAADISFEIEPV